MKRVAPLAPPPPLAKNNAALRHAGRVLRNHPIIDGHNDLAWAIRHYPKAPRDVEAYDLRRRTPGNSTRSVTRGVG